MYQPNEKFMKLAIKEAEKNNKKWGDFAIGAVVVCGDKVIAKSGNEYVKEKYPSTHAEVVVIKKACKKLGKEHLYGCVLYTTNEPCPMCATACVIAEMSGVVYGANKEDMRNHWMKDKGESDKEYKRVDISCEELFERSNPKPFLIKEFMRGECNKLFSLY